MFTDQPLLQNEKDELTYIITSGSFGISDHMDYHLAAKNLNGDDSKRAKRDYYFRRFFISGDILKKRYPFVYRHKTLYPLFLVYRSFKGLFISRRQLLHEYRDIKAYRKDAENAFNYENDDTKND